ncbi:MAG: M28 family peptidase [Planctomycetes bacterium]|nr:M28 family peptidase [Planctomycetota bacterium]
MRSGTAMRWSTIFAVTVLGLGACIGAAVADKRARTQDEPKPVRQQAAIDQQRVLPLEPVRAPADLGERAMAHARALCEFGPRYAGVPGWSKQLDYIEATLAALGIDVRRDTWTDRKELLTFSNLTATLPGKRKERVVLACHHDTKCTTGHDDPAHNFHFVGANDGASGVALLLALAPVLKATEREATIELVFFDGEESLDWRWNEAARALFGSKRLAKRHRDALLLGKEPRIEALILLDMVGRKELHIQEELYSTELLRRITWSAAVATGHRQQFFRRAEAAADDHKPFLEVGIPAIDLIDLNGNPDWHTAADTLDKMSPQSLQAVADVVLTMLPAVEKAYVTERK